MRNLICVVFGHRPKEGYYSDHKGNSNQYLDVKLDVVDGIGRQHAQIITLCRRCLCKYRVGMIHVPKITEEDTGLAHRH